MNQGEFLSSEKVELFQEVSLSQKSVTEQITNVAQDTETTIKQRAKKCQFLCKVGNIVMANEGTPLLSRPNSGVTPSLGH